MLISDCKQNGSCESKNHCSGNPYDDIIIVFVGWPHVWVIASLENENEPD